MKSAAEIIANLDQIGIRSLETNNHLNLDIGGNTYPITLEDVDISSEDLPGWFVATDGKLTVALDTALTDELRAEGIAREIVNRVQNIRKVWTYWLLTASIIYRKSRRNNIAILLRRLY